MADTRSLLRCDIVPGMVTKKRLPHKPIRPARRPFYLKEWRLFMGTKAIDLAIALDIERESYYRLERNWWTINVGEMAIIADTIGVKPTQLWFPPPEKGAAAPVTADALMEDIPENMRPAAFMALRGMAQK
jgi:hypothetical protein